MPGPEPEGDGVERDELAEQLANVIDDFPPSSQVGGAPADGVVVALEEGQGQDSAATLSYGEGPLVFTGLDGLDSLGGPVCHCLGRLFHFERLPELAWRRRLPARRADPKGLVVHWLY